MEKSNTNEFILKAKKVYGDKYDYSKVEYINSQTKVCIICSKHGEFWMRPNSHLRGQNCPKCGNLSKGLFKKDTLESFIRKAREVHGWKYDYSKVNYVDSQTKVCIICPKHGEFWQKPNGHLNGQGCPKCNGGKKYTTEDFIKISQNCHGNKYDYSKSNYINRDTKVCIICPEHGEFYQSPHEHMHGCGCPKCTNSQKLTKDDFIKRASKIHQNKYDYSKVEYKNNKTKVCIICPEHGEFWQTPSSHINQKSGCPICKESHLEKKCRLILNEYNIKYKEQAKKDLFPWLKKLSLDFYLPEYNIAIECQGKQHFLMNCNFGSKNSESLDVIQKRDENKKQLCEENGITLIYFSNLKIHFPYDVITKENELIKTILNSKK